TLRSVFRVFGDAAQTLGVVRVPAAFGDILQRQGGCDDASRTRWVEGQTCADPADLPRRDLNRLVTLVFNRVVDSDAPFVCPEGFSYDNTQGGVELTFEGEGVLGLSDEVSLLVDLPDACYRRPGPSLRTWPKGCSVLGGITFLDKGLHTFHLKTNDASTLGSINAHREFANHQRVHV